VHVFILKPWHRNSARCYTKQRERDDKPVMKVVPFKTFEP
jgi:hypothetical protein